MSLFYAKVDSFLKDSNIDFPWLEVMFLLSAPTTTKFIFYYSGLASLNAKSRVNYERI